jgi:hypothetical protein
LLVAGIRRQPEDDAPTEESEPAGGHPPPRTEKKRRAWMEIARPAQSVSTAWRPLRPASRSSHFLRFPAVAALVSIYGIFADPGTIRVHLDDLASILSSGAIEVMAISSRASPLAKKARSARLFSSRLGCPSGARMPE